MENNNPVACGIAESCLAGSGPPNAVRCKDCPYKSALPPPEISVIVATRDESGDWLFKTCDSILKQNRWLRRLIVIDDASLKPVVVPDGVIVDRNPEPLGCDGSRHIGFSLIQGAGYTIFNDPHMTFPPRFHDKLARMAQVTGGCVYAGCNEHFAADFKTERGVLRCKWRDRELVAKIGTRFQRTTAFMGAGYCWNNEQLRNMGGWMYLPGVVGWEEEAMSLLTLKHGIPIYADTQLQSWHLFKRNQSDLRPECAHMPVVEYPCPASHYWVNLAAAYRLVFEDVTWNAVKGRLLAFGVPKACIEEVEDPEVVEYGRQLKERCKLTDAELLMELVEAVDR